MWDMNNWFLVMTPDMCHPFLGGVIVIHHHETLDIFMAVDIELKGDLLDFQETNMHVRDLPYIHQYLCAQPYSPVTQK